MKYVLEFDDFSPRMHNLHLYEELHDHYPDFKVTLFTVPWEIRFGAQAPITQPEFEPWCKAVRQAVSEGWMEIAVHGLTHAPLEFGEISADGAFKRLTIACKMFENRKIPYAKIFKAPFWALSKEGKEKITSMGFAVVEDGYFHWNLADHQPPALTDTGSYCVAHGHVNAVCGNGIEDVFDTLMRLPPNTEFAFLSDYLKSTGALQ